MFSPKFSEYNQDEIFFVKAKEYSNHSPIVRKHSNGMDLYSYNLKTKKIKVYTHSNYYNIECYDFINRNEFIVNSYEGIYKYSIVENQNEEELALKNKNIEPVYIDQFYDSSISYSQEIKKYLLSTYNEVYLWNGIDDKLEKKYTCESAICQS